MKKILSTLIAAVLVLTALFTLVACGEETQQGNPLDEMIAAAHNMTEEELVAAAKAETGAFVAYGNTSRITTAMGKFKKAYPQLGLGDDSAAQKLNDSEIYTKLLNESRASNKAKNASMVLIQDSAQLDVYRTSSSILTNYVPAGMEDKVDEENRLPLAHQFINKLFIYNTVGENTARFSNVWELTQESHKGKIYFKNPNTESVNMNFLIMLTSDEWSAKLGAAYQELNGAEATDVGEGKTYANYGYKWVTEFLKNCDFTITSDTTIAGTLSTEENAGMMGLFVLSKFRDKSVNQNNVQVSAWDKDENDNFVTITPFAGFMYSIYAQLATSGPRPYTAMLFVNYLMTEEGFTPWASLGGYSSNVAIPVTDGDQPLSFWKQTLVIENGAYISSVKTEVVDYINKILG